MSQSYKVLLLCGSTRKGAHNAKLLQAVAALAPEDFVFTTYDALKDLPNYSEDLEGAQPPPAVKILRDAITAADAIIVASPEYNHSVPGALKNAIDWVSRPYGAPSLTGKSMAIFVSTVGRGFGFNGLAELRRIAIDMVNYVVPGPQVVIHDSANKFSQDAEGRYRLDDPMACHLIRAQLHGLHAALQQNAGKLVRAPMVYLAENAP